MKINPNGYIEVLSISKRGKPYRVYLHRKGGDTVYCELPGAYGMRTAMPHTEVFEMRRIILEEVDSYAEAEYLRALARVGTNNTKSDSPDILEAFNELFYAAHGFYYPHLEELMDID